MIDIDRFKDYNDRHGHLAGDQVLRQVADALAANTRPSDRVYRFGGEEFLVLLPGATIIDALAVAERQRPAVADLGIRTDRPDRTDADEVVTISVGVAPLEAGSSNPTATVDEWLRAADAAMYESKMNGRNRVTVARPDPRDTTPSPSRPDACRQPDRRSAATGPWAARQLGIGHGGPLSPAAATEDCAAWRAEGDVMRRFMAIPMAGLLALTLAGSALAGPNVGNYSSSLTIAQASWEFLR